MRKNEYTVEEIRALLDSMSGMYDLVRAVDPIECRILNFKDNGEIGMSERCYSIWNAEQKCANCTSALAYRTGCNQQKSEYFQDKYYRIQSNPVKIKLPDGSSYNAVVEFVNVEDGFKKDFDVNDRDAENIDEKSLRFRAFHDELTGTLKPDVFFEKSRELIKKNPDIAWTMITGDFMEFRLFSSLFGAEKANEALIKTSELLEKIADEAGGICSRLYKDKFGVLIPTENYSEIALIDAANTIRSAMSNGIYTLCIHFGVYNMINPDIPVALMCDRANMAIGTIHRDIHMSVAYFDGEIMKKRLLEQEIISGFDDALRSGRFTMYLQPLTCEDGVPFGAEALVRLVGPDGTVSSPAEFIDILEKAGLIHELDRNIWEQAVRQLALWKGTDKDHLTISVNMSAKDFYSMDIYKVLTELTEKYGVDNSRLRIEITESALVKEPERSYPVIAKLQKAGFLVEIDDFGKGQSSLSLLKDINADVLKIDMEFLRETENAKRSEIILQAVIAMAKELGMQVITEGVETEKQLKSLSEMGCSRFQGYYFSKPIPVSEFESKYSNN